ncbi:MAG: radical SAM protein [archaeon]|jgi:MoaA/NifB/PqqE/SkfB family radical SAM enzyme
MKIGRIRVDSQGLLVQNNLGQLRRIALKGNKLKEAQVNTKEFIEKNYKNDNFFKDLFLPNKILSTRIECFPEDLGFMSRPIRIYYGVEPRCNLACKFCGPRDFHEKLEKGSNEKEDFLLKQFADAGSFQVQLTGGEIFLRGWKVLDLIKKTNELGLAVILSTNGIWDHIENQEELLKEINKIGNVIQTKISIEGDEAFHDSVRGKGNYKKSVETLKLLSKYNLNPRISATIFKGSCNKKQLEHLVNLALQTNAGLQTIPIRTAGMAKELSCEVPTKKQIEDYTKYATKLRKETGVKLSFNFDIFDGTTQINIYDTQAPISCGAPLMGFHVTHTGECYACGFAQEIPQFLTGKIDSKNSYLKLWQNSQILNKFRKTKKSNKCRRCKSYGKGCWGGCWVMAWLSTGKINGLDPYCPKYGSDKLIAQACSKAKETPSYCTKKFDSE